MFYSFLLLYFPLHHLSLLTDTLLLSFHFLSNWGFYTLGLFCFHLELRVSSVFCLTLYCCISTIICFFLQMLYFYKVLNQFLLKFSEFFPAFLCLWNKTLLLLHFYPDFHLCFHQTLNEQPILPIFLMKYFWLSYLTTPALPQ